MQMIRRIKTTCENIEAEKDKFLKILASYTGGEIKAGDRLNDIWENLIFWAFADDRSKYDLQKGFAFIGSVGTSKSVTIRAFADYLEQGNFWILHTDEKLARRGKLKPGQLFKFKNKIKVIPESNLIQWFLNDANPYSDQVGLEHYINRPVAICVDEVGAGPKYYNHYGNKINLFAQFFNRRTDLNYLTHFTSNLNLEQLHRHFDEPLENTAEIIPRFKSRLAAAVNLVDFTESYDLRGTIKTY